MIPCRVSMEGCVCCITLLNLSFLRLRPWQFHCTIVHATLLVILRSFLVHLHIGTNALCFCSSFLISSSCICSTSSAIFPRSQTTPHSVLGQPCVSQVVLLVPFFSSFDFVSHLRYLFSLCFSMSCLCCGTGFLLHYGINICSCYFCVCPLFLRYFRHVYLPRHCLENFLLVQNAEAIKW